MFRRSGSPGCRQVGLSYRFLTASAYFPALTLARAGPTLSRGGGVMSKETSRYLKFGGATLVILLALGYLAFTGVQESKSYYVTIKELKTMGDGAYTKRLRVA